MNISCIFRSASQSYIYMHSVYEPDVDFVLVWQFYSFPKKWQLVLISAHRYHGKCFVKTRVKVAYNRYISCVFWRVYFLCGNCMFFFFFVVRRFHMFFLFPSFVFYFSSMWRSVLCSDFSEHDPRQWQCLPTPQHLRHVLPSLQRQHQYQGMFIICILNMKFLGSNLNDYVLTNDIYDWKYR